MVNTPSKGPTVSGWLQTCLAELLDLEAQYSVGVGMDVSEGVVAVVDAAGMVAVVASKGSDREMNFHFHRML
jgi:hypothetical protein